MCHVETEEKMTNRLLIGACLLLAFMVRLDVAYPVAKPTEELSVSSALFDRFETVVYTKIDLLSTSGAYGKISDRDASRLRTPFTLLVGGFDRLGDQASGEILRSAEAVWVGAKNFHAPEGLGLVRSQFCYVMLLKKDSKFEIHRYFAHSLALDSAGGQVWSWSVDYGEFAGNGSKPTSLFATQVGDSFFVVANDLSELKSVVQKLSHPTGGSVNSVPLRDFESVSHHKFWGYRRYRHDGITDPVAAGMTGVTSSAEALFFYVDVDNKSAVVGLFSSRNDQTTAENLNAQLHSFRLEPHGSAAWQASIPLAGNEESFDRVFMVMGLLGFAIYL
jgi:hypothetical protein